MESPISSTEPPPTSPTAASSGPWPVSPPSPPLVTTSEIYIEHYKASFGNKMMWSPIIVTPPLVVAGVAGVFSKKWAKTALPVTAAIYTLNGLVGEYFHIRGVARKPGGFKLASYNLPMGPPISAPGLMSVVGGMGLLAALLRRED